MKNGKVIPSILLLAILTGGGWWYFSQAKAAATTDSAANQQADSHTDKAGKKRRNGFGGGAGGGEGRPIPVLVAQVKEADVRVIQTAVGTVTPSAVVTVSSRVNGELTRVRFKEGQLVRAGEVLAEIDARPFQAALTQVQGQALRNQALLRNAQIDLERYKTLQAQDSIASQQVDAQASLVQQYQGTVLADQGLVDNAKLQLSFTRITSPINGRIGLRQVDLGNNITTANALAVVNTVDPIDVVFTLPEDRVSGLLQRLAQTHQSGKGLPVEAWDRGNSNLLAKGSLVSLDNQIDTTSGTVKLKAKFSNKDNTLFPNQFVNVRLLSDTLRDSVVIPSAAVQHGSAGTFVYLLDKQPDETKVSVQQVKLGTVDGDNVAVLEGLQAKQQVVISGIDKLRDNAKVTIASAKSGREGKYGRDGRGKHGNHDNQGDKAGNDGNDVKTPKDNAEANPDNIGKRSWKHAEAGEAGSHYRQKAAQ